MLLSLFYEFCSFEMTLPTNKRKTDNVGHVRLGRWVLGLRHHLRALGHLGSSARTASEDVSREPNYGRVRSDCRVRRTRRRTHSAAQPGRRRRSPNSLAPSLVHVGGAAPVHSGADPHFGRRRCAVASCESWRTWPPSEPRWPCARSTTRTSWPSLRPGPGTLAAGRQDFSVSLVMTCYVVWKSSIWCRVRCTGRRTHSARHRLGGLVFGSIGC